MGLLKAIFGGSSEPKVKKVLPWIALNSTEQFDDIIKSSKVKPQLIFKYSTRCGISRMVLRQFENTYNFSENDFGLYFLDLINYRNVSNEVGYKFQVLHESPQLLVIKKGVVVAHSSHNGVIAIDLSRFI